MFRVLFQFSFLGQLQAYNTPLFIYFVCVGGVGFLKAKHLDIKKIQSQRMVLRS